MNLRLILEARPRDKYLCVSGLFRSSSLRESPLRAEELGFQTSALIGH